MIPRHITGATHRYGKPEQFDEAKHGRCGTLPVREVNGICQSAWEPTPAELDMLNAGGSVILSIMGSQPPVSLTVEPALAEPTEPVMP